MTIIKVVDGTNGLGQKYPVSVWQKCLGKATHCLRENEVDRGNIVATLWFGDRVTILKSHHKVDGFMCKVRTPKGIVGYVHNMHLKPIE